jgi:hypothetical protein
MADYKLKWVYFFDWIELTQLTSILSCRFLWYYRMHASVLAKLTQPDSS